MGRVLPFTIVNVFTQERFGGNPLCVVEQAEGLTDDEMQAVARQLNVSETTFVLPSRRPDCDQWLRIFTPRFEIPMAGHPTVGTAFVLGRPRVVFEEGVGPVVVEQVAEHTFAMVQPALSRDRALGADEAAQAAAALGLSAEDLLADLPVEVVRTGLPFMLVPLNDVEALGRARFHPGAWGSVRGTASGLYPFAPVDGGVRARLLGVEGIDEDPATGSAAGPLGAYLRHHGRDPGRLSVWQGVEVGRPSLIEVECREENGRWVPTVLGPSMRAGEGRLFL